MTWEDRWKTGRTFWDAGAAAPALLSMIAERSSASPIDRALVPGCGSGYDVFALAQAATQVVGLDVAPTAGTRFKEIREGHGLTQDRADIVIGDFFAFEPKAPFDIIWDYTFLCALELEDRHRWAQRMHALLRPGGELWTLIFPVDPVPLNPGGAPYPMTTKLVRELLVPTFEEISCAEVFASHPGRLGKEWLACWRRS